MHPPPPRNCLSALTSAFPPAPALGQSSWPTSPREHWGLQGLAMSWVNPLTPGPLLSLQTEPNVAQVLQLRAQIERDGSCVVFCCVPSALSIAG